MARTGIPAAAMAALTSPIACWFRWKIEAARTAEAPPSRTAATKSAGPAAPPEAMTGTPDQVGDRAQERRVEARLGPVAVDRGHEQLAGTQRRDALGPAQRVKAGRLAAALHDDLPAGRVGLAGLVRRFARGSGAPGLRPGGRRTPDSRRASIATTTAWLPNRRRSAGHERRVPHGGRVERHLVGAGPEHVAHLGDAAHAATDGERHEGPPGRPLDDVEERAPTLGRGGDVEVDTISSAPSRAYRSARSGGSPSSTRSTKRVPLTTRPSATSRQGITRAQHAEHPAARCAPRGPARRSWRAGAGRRGRSARDGTGVRPAGPARPLRRTSRRARSRQGRGRRSAGPRRRNGRSRSRPRRRSRRRGDGRAVVEPGSSRCGAGGAPARVGRSGRPGRRASPRRPRRTRRTGAAGPGRSRGTGRSAAIQSRIGSSRPRRRMRAMAGPRHRRPGRPGRRRFASAAGPRAITTCAPAIASACSMLTRLPAP